MKAKGCSGSRRFSARLKCTRPTRFQAGLSPLRKVCKIGWLAASDAANAAPSSSHSASRTSAFRYSAPGIIGAVSTKVAISPSVGGGTAGRRPRTTEPRGRARGEQAQRPHVSRREVAPPDEGGGQGLADLARPQLQKAVPGAPGERLLQTRHGLFMHRRRVFSPFGQKMPVRRQT